MPTTIVNARIFDGVRVIDATRLRLANGGVAEVGRDGDAPSGDTVTDAAGGTLLPGLIDAHVHLLPGALHQALIFGITTVCDLFSRPEQWHPEADRARDTSEVADVRSASVGATAPGGHPSMTYAPFHTLTGPADADAEHAPTALAKTLEPLRRRGQQRLGPRRRDVLAAV